MLPSPFGSTGATVLHGPRLRLRPFAADDLGWFSTLHGDPRVMAHLRGGVQSQAQVEAQMASYREAFAAHGFGMWLILERESGQRLGECGVMDWRADYGDFAARIALHPDAWRRGFAAEAMTVVLDRVLDGSTLQQLLALASPRNHASHQLLGRLGFALDRPVLDDDGTVIRYRLTAQAWQARRRSGGDRSPSGTPARRSS